MHYVMHYVMHRVLAKMGWPSLDRVLSKMAEASLRSVIVRVLINPNSLYHTPSREPMH